VVTIFLDDLHDQVAAIAARGLEPGERETVGLALRLPVERLRKPESFQDARVEEAERPGVDQFEALVRATRC
jgi:Arc/MetJ family transcription regulator